MNNFDETGTRVNKKTMWVHSASNELSTYLTISEKRGTTGMVEGGVLTSFNGIAVHDCWKPYWKFESIKYHSVCCAHLLRELAGVTENNPEQKWAKRMSNLLLWMKKIKRKALSEEKESLSNYYLNIINKKYDMIVDDGRKQNPITEKKQRKRGKKPKGKLRSLIERFSEYKEAICLFVHDFTVPFDNNQAERDIRMIKVKTKVSGCFRTKDGTEDFLKIMSYIGTANKRGINSFSAIKYAIMNRSDFIFE